PVGSWGRSCGFSLPFPRDRSASHRAVHSFPTRRSSDLLWPQWRDAVLRLRPLRHAPVELPPALIAAVEHVRPRGDPVRVVDRDDARPVATRRYVLGSETRPTANQDDRAVRPQPWGDGHGGAWVVGTTPPVRRRDTRRPVRPSTDPARSRSILPPP